MSVGKKMFSFPIPFSLCSNYLLGALEGVPENVYYFSSRKALLIRLSRAISC